MAASSGVTSTLTSTSMSWCTRVTRGNDDIGLAFAEGY